MIRAGVIGLGVGERHVDGYRAHPQADVVALADVDADQLAAVGERTGVSRLTTEPLELIEDPDIDVLSIASYDDAHYDQVKGALEHGKHVFVEKPLCLYEQQAVEIAALMHDRPELRVSSNLPLRLSPRFQLLRDLIARGDLGEPFHLEGDYDYGRVHKLIHGWRGKQPYYSAILGGAVHMVDLLLWLVPGQRVVEVTATGNRTATRGTQFGWDSFVLLTLRFESDLVAKVTTNLGAVGPHFHGVRVYGTRGTFVNALPDGRLYRRTGDEGEFAEEAIDAPYPGVAKGDLIHSFVQAIMGEGQAEVTERDVLATMAVCFAAERSLRESRPAQVVELTR
jgi:predicted dehydrogenase